MGEKVHSHPELSIPIILFIISIILIIVGLLVSSEYETIPTQVLINDTFYDIYVKYDSAIAVDPLQTTHTVINVFFEPLNTIVYPNSSKAPEILSPSLLDFSNDNSTSILKATDFKDISEFAEIGKRKYEASLTATHPNVRIGSVKEDFVLQIIYSTVDKPKINYTTIDIPISFLIILNDINPVVYLFIIITGVCASIFVTEYKPDSQRIPKSRIIFWLIISAITATVVFSQFRQQLAPDSDLFTNIIFALAFGFGAQRVISEATSRPETPARNNGEDKVPTTKH